MVTTPDTTATAVELDGAAMVEAPRRRGRPPGQRAGVGGADGLQVQTTKAYRLTNESHRTVGQLRRILGQRGLPDEAQMTFDGDRITIDWTE